MLKDLSDRALKSLEKLLAREDVILNKEVVEEYVNAGYWDERSIVDYVKQYAQERPEVQTLIDEDGQRITYAQFDQLSDAFALNLARLGFQEEDVLGIQTPNWSEFFIAHLGAAKIKVLPVNLHTIYREHELEYILGHTGAKGLIVPGYYRRFDYNALAQRLKEKLPDLKHIIIARSYCEEDALPFEALTVFPAGINTEVLEERRPTGFDPWFLFVTSGTTGRPKLVIHTHNSMLSASRSLARLFNLNPTDKWLAVAPVGHSLGVGYYCGMATPSGATLALISTWNAERAVEIIERERITHTVCPTPMLMDLLRLPEIEKRHLDSLKIIVYGGAPCPAEVIRRIHSLIGCEVTPFYGYSEGFVQMLCPLGSPVEITSTRVGRPTEGCKAKVVDDQGNAVPDGDVGEFWVRGHTLAVGYFKQPDYTRRLMTSDGWFKSGDALIRDEQGFYRYVGRVDDLISRGGQKIDPKEVEDILFAYPHIDNVAVVGMPDERLGWIACAFVVPKDIETLTLEELQTFLSEKGLARWKWPERLVIKKELPVGPSGKLMRSVLVEEAGRLAKQ